MCEDMVKFIDDANSTTQTLLYSLCEAVHDGQSEACFNIADEIEMVLDFLMDDLSNFDVCEEMTYCP
jgi:hypothetical protein